MHQMAKVDPTLASMTAGLTEAYGLLMTPADVRDLLKCGRATAYEWLEDVDAVRFGKRKLYRAEDVAAKVIACREKKGA